MINLYPIIRTRYLAAPVIFLLLLLTGMQAFAQQDINAEEFTCSFSPSATGADIVYLGKTHSFSLKVKGDSIKETNPEGKASNQEFINLGKNVLQTSLVPLPANVMEGLQLGSLSEEQQKAILLGYINYELDYFDNELHLGSHNLKKEWKTIDSHLYLVWYFEFKPPADSVKGETVAAQAYLSTVCFNQVLDINVPLTDTKDYTRAEALLETVAGTLKTYNEKLQAGK